MSLAKDLAMKHGCYGRGQKDPFPFCVSAINEALERAAQECDEAKSAHVNLDEKSRDCHQIDANRIRALKDSK